MTTLVGEFTYAASPRVIIGMSPGFDGPEPLFGPNSKRFTTRLDSLFKDWSNQAIGANCWWYADDWVNKRPSHLEQILRETRCVTIIALGVMVQRELGLQPRDAVPYGEEEIKFEGRTIHVVRFPDPSDRNRHWKFVPNRIRAQDSLRKNLL